MIEEKDLDQAKARELYEASRSVFDNPIARHLAESVKTKCKAKELDRHMNEQGWSREVAKAVRALALLRLENQAMYKDFSSGWCLSAQTMAGFSENPGLMGLRLQESWVMGPDTVDISGWPTMMRGVAWAEAGSVEGTSLFGTNQTIQFQSGRSYRDYLGSGPIAVQICQGERQLRLDAYRDPDKDKPVDELVVRYQGVVGVHHVDNFLRFFQLTTIERGRAEDDGIARPQETLLIAVPCDCGPREGLRPGFMVYKRAMKYIHGDWRLAEDFTVSVEAGFSLMHNPGGWHMVPCNFNQFIGAPIDLPSVHMTYHHGTHFTGYQCRQYPALTEEAVAQELMPAYQRLIAAKRTPEDDARLLGDYLFAHPETDLLDLLAPAK